MPKMEFVVCTHKNDQIIQFMQTIRIMLGSTMVELSTTHQANSPTSLDVLLQQHQDPVPPLSSPTDHTTAATSSPPEITSSPQPISPPPEITPSPQPQATEASAACATGTTEVAPVENQESKEEQRKQEKWRRDMRGWLLMVATVFATMTYQAGLNPPGGFWQDDQPTSQLCCNGTKITNTTTPSLLNAATYIYNSSSNMATPSDETRHVAGDAILEDKKDQQYSEFFFTNHAAFIYSMTSIMLLLSEPMCNAVDNLIGLQSLLIWNAAFVAAAYSLGCGRHYGKMLPLQMTVLCTMLLGFLGCLANIMRCKITSRLANCLAGRRMQNH